MNDMIMDGQHLKKFNKFCERHDKKHGSYAGAIGGRYGIEVT